MIAEFVLALKYAQYNVQNFPANLKWTDFDMS